MPRKNIYIREQDVLIWEEAETLADNDSFSVVLTEALRGWVESKKASEENGPYERIELDVSNINPASNAVTGMRTIAFTGRELADGYTPDQALEVNVYETAKHQLLFYRHSSGYDYAVYQVYKDLTEAAEDYDEHNEELVNDGQLISEVAEALNEKWVEELDI